MADIPVWSGRVGSPPGDTPIPLPPVESLEIDAYLKGLKSAEALPSTASSLSRGFLGALEVYQKSEQNAANIDDTRARARIHQAEAAVAPQTAAANNQLAIARANYAQSLATSEPIKAEAEILKMKSEGIKAEIEAKKARQEQQAEEARLTRISQAYSDLEQTLNPPNGDPMPFFDALERNFHQTLRAGIELSKDGTVAFDRGITAQIVELPARMQDLKQPPAVIERAERLVKRYEEAANNQIAATKKEPISLGKKPPEAEILDATDIALETTGAINITDQTPVTKPQNRGNVGAAIGQAAFGPLGAAAGRAIGEKIESPTAYGDRPVQKEKPLSDKFKIAVIDQVYKGRKPENDPLERRTDELTEQYLKIPGMKSHEAADLAIKRAPNIKFDKEDIQQFELLKARANDLVVDSAVVGAALNRLEAYFRAKKIDYGPGNTLRKALLDVKASGGTEEEKQVLADMATVNAMGFKTKLADLKALGITSLQLSSNMEQVMSTAYSYSTETNNIARNREILELNRAVGQQILDTMEIIDVGTELGRSPTTIKAAANLYQRLNPPVELKGDTAVPTIKFGGTIPQPDRVGKFTFDIYNLEDKFRDAQGRAQNADVTKEMNVFAQTLSSEFDASKFGPVNPLDVPKHHPNGKGSDMLFRSQIWADLRNDPNASSPQGASVFSNLDEGIRKAGWKEFGFAGEYDPYDVRKNIKIGMVHMNRQLKRFGGDTELALATVIVGEQKVIDAYNKVKDIHGEQTWDGIRDYIEDDVEKKADEYIKQVMGDPNDPETAALKKNITSKEAESIVSSLATPAAQEYARNNLTQEGLEELNKTKDIKTFEQAEGTPFGDLMESVLGFGATEAQAETNEEYDKRLAEHNEEIQSPKVVWPDTHFSQQERDEFMAESDALAAAKYRKPEDRFNASTGDHFNTENNPDLETALTPEDASREEYPGKYRYRPSREKVPELEIREFEQRLKQRPKETSLLNKLNPFAATEAYADELADNPPKSQGFWEGVAENIGKGTVAQTRGMAELPAAAAKLDWQSLKKLPKDTQAYAVGYLRSALWGGDKEALAKARELLFEEDPDTAYENAAMDAESLKIDRPPQFFAGEIHGAFNPLSERSPLGRVARLPLDVGRKLKLLKPAKDPKVRGFVHGAFMGGVKGASDAMQTAYIAGEGSYGDRLSKAMEVAPGGLVFGGVFGGLGKTLEKLFHTKAAKKAYLALNRKSEVELTDAQAMLFATALKDKTPQQIQDIENYINSSQYDAAGILDELQEFEGDFNALLSASLQSDKARKIMTDKASMVEGSSAARTSNMLDQYAPGPGRTRPDLVQRGQEVLDEPAEEVITSLYTHAPRQVSPQDRQAFFDQAEEVLDVPIKLNTIPKVGKGPIPLHYEAFETAAAGIKITLKNLFNVRKLKASPKYEAAKETLPLISRNREPDDLLDVPDEVRGFKGAAMTALNQNNAEVMGAVIRAHGARESLRNEALPDLAYDIQHEAKRILWEDSIRLEGNAKYLANNAYHQLRSTMRTEAKGLEEADKIFFDGSQDINRFHTKGVENLIKFTDPSGVVNMEKFGNKLFQMDKQSIANMMKSLSPEVRLQVQQAARAHLEIFSAGRGPRAQGEVPVIPKIDLGGLGDKIKVIFGDDLGNRILKNNRLAIDLVREGTPQTISRIIKAIDDPEALDRVLDNLTPLQLKGLIGEFPKQKGATFLEHIYAQKIERAVREGATSGKLIFALNKIDGTVTAHTKNKAIFGARRGQSLGRKIDGAKFKAEQNLYANIGKLNTLANNNDVEGFGNALMKLTPQEISEVVKSYGSSGEEFVQNSVKQYLERLRSPKTKSFPDFAIDRVDQKVKAALGNKGSSMLRGLETETKALKTADSTKKAAVYEREAAEASKMSLKHKAQHIAVDLLASTLGAFFTKQPGYVAQGARRGMSRYVGVTQADEKISEELATVLTDRKLSVEALAQVRKAIVQAKNNTALKWWDAAVEKLKTNNAMGSKLGGKAGRVVAQQNQGYEPKSSKARADYKKTQNRVY